MVNCVMKESHPAFTGLGDLSPEELFDELPTPCYILDETMLRRNGEILAGVAERTGCKILLAQKAFSNYGLYPVLAFYLAGTEASGLYEARLGAEEMPGKEVHVFCGAYVRLYIIYVSRCYEDVGDYVAFFVYCSVVKVEKALWLTVSVHIPAVGIGRA